VRAAAYESDPLVFKNATARWFTETVRAQKNAFARASSLSLPLLVVVAGADPVAKTADARASSTPSLRRTRRGTSGRALPRDAQRAGVARDRGEIASWVLARSA